MSKNSCRYCLSERPVKLFSKEKINIYFCKKCRIVFSDKFLDQKENQILYSEEYYKNLKNFSAITETRYIKILNFIAHKTNGRQLLDLGCGCGHFLKVAKENGWDAQGFDVSEAISGWVRKELSINVKCGEFIDTDFNEKFDAITLFESIEHIDKPDIYLKKINFMLKDSGILFLTTPNFSSLSRRILSKNWRVFCAEHIFYYSPETLKKLLAKNGFKILSCATKNLSVIELKNAFSKKNSDFFQKEQESLRSSIENSSFLKLLANSANCLLRLLNMGDSIWIFAKKIK